MHVKSKHDQETLSAIPAGDDHQHSQTPANRRRRYICFSITLTLLAAVALLILILSLTVFKSKKPITTVNSVVLKHVNATVTLLPIRVSLNISVDINISVRNPNKVTVRYRNSSAALRYYGQHVGNAPIPAGKIGSGDTKQLNLTLTIFADRLLTDLNLDFDIYRDVIGGNFPVTTYTRISGTVRVVNLFNIHVVSTSTCDLSIDILKRRIVDQRCHYKNKL